MKTEAAVLVELGKPLELAELELPSLKPGQVLVEVAYSGVCHTQILECRGYRGEDRFLPHCLGHEGAGIVREAGPGVGKVKAGDRVILSWMKGSGADVNSTVYRWGGKAVNAGAITTFGRHSVISENRLTALPKEVPLRLAAFLGCAVPTGVGAVLNTARAESGQSLAVFGVGGIGLFAVAGAAAAGCAPVVAIDMRQDRLDAARRMGATHAILAGKQEPVSELRKLVPRGLDIAVEATGRPQAMRQALECVRDRGGSAVIVGNARHGERLEIDPRQLNFGKRLLGSWGGDNDPDVDFPKYCGLVASRRLDLEPVASNAYALDKINEAVDDMEQGKVLRPLIVLAGG